MQSGPPWHRFLVMTSAPTGVEVTSGCAWIRSEQSDGAGEPSHGSLSAQRECKDRQAKGAQWVRGVQMVDNNSYMLARLSPVCLISYLSQNLISLYLLPVILF